MTFTIADMLLLILAAAAVVVTVILIRLSGQLMRTAAQLEEVARHVNYLKPRIERLVDEIEQEVAALRNLTRKADQIADDVETVSTQARRMVLPALSSLSAVSESLRYVGAALVGAKVGLKVLRSRRKKGKDED